MNYDYKWLTIALNRTAKSKCVIQVLLLHSKQFGKRYGASGFFAAPYA
jgi:hypothetical protein